MKFILGKKMGMTQVLDKERGAIPVTIVEAGPCRVCQIKTAEKDGYDGAQVGFMQDQRAKKSQKSAPYRFLCEIRGSFDLSAGDEISVDVFSPGDKVGVSGISKGKGFAGTVKRWNFKGASATHGTKHTQRAPGSIGSMFPQRVFKGKKMAGRMGGEKITVKNLEVISVDKEENIIAIQGAIPGKRGGLVAIKGI